MQHIQRRLAAILAADMVGYSRLIEQDEAGTIQRLKSDREALIDPAIAAHGGRIVRLAGDGALVEFSSVVEGAQCAIDIQQGMEKRNAERTQDQQIVFRMGINLGDIVVEDDNLHGEGINIAARLEGLAPPGGIFLSEEAARHVDGKVSESAEFVSVQTVKNIERPVRIWQIVVSERANGVQKRPAPPQKRRWRYVTLTGCIFAAVTVFVLWKQAWIPRFWEAPHGYSAQSEPANPSIAVLPFKNLSGEPEQEYFSDGISEDIIIDLSRLSNLDVIARNSSFLYKGAALKLQDIGAELGVDYVLEGSVRKGAAHLRVTAQLANAKNGHQLWAERYDRELTDVFALQDDITQKIVAALSIQFSDTEKRNVGRAATGSFEAYDLFLQAQGSDRFSRDGVELAIEKYRQAIGLDPDFARAYGALAITLSRQVATGLSDSPAESSERALSLARKAVKIDPDSPYAQWALGYVHMRRRQFDVAVEALERAISLSPSYADSYALMALIKNNVGHPEEAIQLIEKAIELNPFYPRDYLYNLGRSHYALGDYDRAIQYLQEVLERNQSGREPRLFLAATYVQLGRIDDAEWEIAQLQISDPQYTLSHVEKTFSLGDAALTDQFLADLRTAGMEE